MPDGDKPHGEYYIEYVEVGNSVKVTAIDPLTGTEVSIVGSPRATRNSLAKLAAKKLNYVLGKSATLPSEEGEE